MTVNEANEKSAYLQFLTFNINNSFFGIEILDIKEVNVDFELIPIFHAPNGVRGYVNLRGQIYLIIDLRKALGLNVLTSSKNEKIILIKEHIAGQTGIIVDEIGDVILVDSSMIEVASSSGKDEIEHLVSNNLVSGICKLKSNLMIILNVNNILDIIKN